MNRNRGDELQEYDPEIERTFRQRRRVAMAERENQDIILPPNNVDGNQPRPRTLRDYTMPNLQGAETSIQRPPITGN